MALDPNVMASGGLFAALMGMVALIALVSIAFYIYMALAMMKTAQRLKKQNAWLAWIPIGNLVLMADMAGMHWWPVLLVIAMFIPFLNIIAGIALMVYMIIWTWKICEARNKPGWWSIIQIIPFIGGIWTFVMWGILAWGK